jgi:perosamine synthetase
MSGLEIDEGDIEAVMEVLRTGRLALGSKTVQFERMMAEYVGVRHAVAVNSGTAALHLILRTLELRPGDEVIVPSFTFAASVNAILYENAVPVFVDIEPETYNLDPALAARLIGPRTRAIMAVDVFGHPVDWTALQAVASEHGISVVDDSCEALGSEYKGEKVGTFGCAAAFAFYPNKQMTTGEGGIIVTDDDRIASLARSLRNQGRDEHGAWLDHARLGFNYRIDEMSAALGCSQLRRIEDFIARRRSVAAMYSSRLAGLEGVRTPRVSSDVTMSWFVYVITFDRGIDRDAVMTAMDRRGIPTRSYFSPIHLQTYMKTAVHRIPEGLPVTEDIGRRAMALPFYANLSETEVDLVATALEESLREVLV